MCLQAITFRLDQYYINIKADKISYLYKKLKSEITRVVGVDLKAFLT